MVLNRRAAGRCCLLFIFVYFSLFFLFFFGRRRASRFSRLIQIGRSRMSNRAIYQTDPVLLQLTVVSLELSDTTFEQNRIFCVYLEGNGPIYLIVLPVTRRKKFDFTNRIGQ